MDGDDTNGIAVARRGGVTVAEQAGGMADRHLGLLCTPETRFQIASVSKHFTATAVLLLASQSKLSLEDPVSRWFGDCPPGWEAITVHHRAPVFQRPSTASNPCRLTRQVLA
jgi:CubicO group peptidase (beta-lactamase class C family)